MEKYYRFAGVELLIDIPQEKMYSHDRALAPFRVSSVTDPHRFTFSLVEALDPPAGDPVVEAPALRVYREGEASVRYLGSVEQSWEQGYIRVASREKDHKVQLLSSQYPQQVGVHTVLNCLGAEHLVARAGGVIFHSSYIQWQEKAILFTAPSGTGKSTQAELWRTLRCARVINGDRSALRWEQGRIVADGIPFAGSSQICESGTLPLAAVVYLSQAPTTTIRQMRGYEAFFRIWEGCSVNTWDKADMDRVSEMVRAVSERVPVFHLACTPDESAVRALESVLKA